MDIYLDHASTTPLSDGVKKIIYENLDTFGNPSSLHTLGVASEKKIKATRRIICDALKIKEKELLFTSGGTEANNLAIFGLIGKKPGRIITSKVEHPSVLSAYEALEKLGHEVVYLDVDERGIVDVSALEGFLNAETQLVSIMAVNNEIGSIQPIEKIGQLIHGYNQRYRTRIRFHVDAVQAFGKLPIKLGHAHIDLMSMSAHKLNALKGTGALFVREGITLRPLQYGGQQESGIRPGTENLIGIIAFGEAVKDAFIEMDERRLSAEKARITMINRLSEESGVFINGMGEGDSDRYLNEFSPYIINVSFEGVKGEVLLHALEMKGIYVSTGSACSSKKKKYSHVLAAMGLGEKRLDSAIRISFGHMSEAFDESAAMMEIIKTAAELKTIMSKKRK